MVQAVSCTLAPGATVALVGMPPADTTRSGARMLNRADVPLFNLPDAATSVYPLPALLMRRSGKVAMPLLALFVSVPERIPPVGLDPRAIVTASVEFVTTSPNASTIATFTAGESG